MKCATTDSKDTWDWFVFKEKVFEDHSQDVADCAPYLPGSFDRPPRNPTEKINSGYKAWEFLLYLFGLGPGLLYGILPDHLYRSYCKLVAAVRYLYQKKIQKSQLQFIYTYLLQYESHHVQR